MLRRRPSTKADASLILAKHRNGFSTTITVALPLYYSRFSELARA
ncbi:hypothetical protein [Pseudonocardia ammonioxydans]|nr:hypothetical protein [Pseudonocardia ammonioxydans]